MSTYEHTVCGPVVVGDTAPPGMSGPGAYASMYPLLPVPARGLTPTVFADQLIKFRIPYSMPGELLQLASQPGVMFPEDVFRHAIDKPFEIWRAIVRLTALDNSTPPLVFEPQPTTLEKRVRLRFRDTAKNESMMAAPHLVDTLITGDEGTWEWEVPYTLVRSEGFEVQVDTAVFTTFCILDNFNANNCAAALATMTNMRIEITFEGYLLVLQPASETR